FYEKLELKTPGLTEKEKQLATLLRLNFTSKQIAIILNITSESVDINRYRLRKKIALNQGRNLSAYFGSI
ncbi:MAG: LuxR family transcriptional regulator, partial [Chloroflexia bacterium]|nr:LuxR family transcriptional regulator [Chloroflexia bacterium]